MMNAPLLEVRNLSIQFATEENTVEAVKNASFTLEAGETVAVVGESGSGKSVTALALTRLLPEPPALYKSGEIVEYGPAEQVLRNPRHPYTRALIECIPKLGQRQRRLTTIDHDKL